MSPLRRHLRPDFWCQDAPGCRSEPRPPVHHDGKNRFESSLRRYIKERVKHTDQLLTGPIRRQGVFCSFTQQSADLLFSLLYSSPWSSCPYSLNYRDVPGLFLAVENGHQAIAETLICYGANLTTPTYSGATPASLCTFSDSR